MSRPKKRHLEVGWCWRADIDADPPLWAIYGHVDDAEAKAIVDAYEGDAVEVADVSRDFRRVVPCRGSCHGECNGSHLHPTEPGRGASPYTWVEGAR
jgi:hypothetical protein